jgi:energy-coupling factor transporter ATP-binding protein EcfA2
MAALSLERVSFWYPASDRPALRNVSLRVEPGEIVALVGSVGAGCSTLLTVAAGLAPRVTGGRLEGAVRWAGRDGAEASRVLLLPTPWTQLSGMGTTVRDEVAFGPANLGWPLERIRAGAARAMARAGVANLAGRDPLTLSGGELQRVMIAGVLAMEAGVLLLDEPTAELDGEGAVALWALARDEAARGAAVVVATSDLDAVPEVAGRVVWLADGRIRADGAPAAVFGGDAIWREGPGGPAVAEVWRAAGLPAPWPVSAATATRVR